MEKDQEEEEEEGRREKRRKGKKEGTRKVQGGKEKDEIRSLGASMNYTVKMKSCPSLCLSPDIVQPHDFEMHSTGKKSQVGE